MGAAVGVIALVAIGVFIGRRSHKKRKEVVSEETSYYEPAKEALPPPVYRHEAPMDEVARYEAPDSQAPVELAGDLIRAQEAPGHGR